MFDINGQFFTGVSAVAILGSLAYWLRSFPKLFFDFLLRVSTVELSVRSTDQAFQWIEAWLAEQPYSMVSRRVSLSTMDSRHTDESDWQLSPGFGIHYFWWKNRLVIIDRSLSENPNSNGYSKDIQIVSER